MAETRLLQRVTASDLFLLLWDDYCWSSAWERDEDCFELRRVTLGSRRSVAPAELHKT